MISFGKPLHTFPDHALIIGTEEIDVRETESHGAAAIRPIIIVTPVIVTPIKVLTIGVVAPHDDFARTRVPANLFFDVSHVRIALLLVPRGPLLATI
jgi:hypothetical protein